MLSTAQRAGLLLFGLLSLGDLTTILLTDGRTPPWSVAILDAVFGAASLVLVVRAWRRPDHPMRLLLALRVLSALTTLPAFVVSNVPPAALASAVAIVVLTAAAVLLSARGRREAVTA